MKILIISDLFLPFPGGAERLISNIADALAERGHEIHILTSYAKAKSHHPMMIKSINRWDDITSFLDGNIFDAVISHHYFAGLYPEIFELGIPSLEVIHNRQRNPNASLAIFNSKYTASRCNFREGDMIILPPAGKDVVVGCICGWQESQGLRTSIVCPRCDTKREYIGHVKPLPNKFWNGQWYGKGIQLTYQLAKIMPERKFLVLRGEWQDAEYIENIKNVEFMEPVDDIREFYARCRLLLVPSASEDAGTVCQEAAVNGIPAISSTAGGLPETNGGGITLCPHDVLPWVKEIAKLDNPDYYREVTRRQTDYIESLDWPKQFDELDAKLRALCGK